MRFNLRFGWEGTFASSAGCKMKKISCWFSLEPWKGFWFVLLAYCLHLSLSGELNPRRWLKVRNGDWLGCLRRERNKGQWSKHGGKNKDTCMPYLVLLWSWLPPCGVDMETWVEDRRGWAVAVDSPVSPSSVVLPKQPSSKCFRNQTMKRRNRRNFF